MKDAFESGAPLDLISTHTKYAPSQAQWLRPIDDLMPAELDRRSAAAARGVVAHRRAVVPDPAQPRRPAAALPPRSDRPACPETWSAVDRRRHDADTSGRLLWLPVSRPRFRIVRHVLRAARQRRRALVRPRSPAGLRLGCRAVGDRADRRHAPAAPGHAARSARLALRRHLGRRSAPAMRRWCRTGRAAITSIAIPRPAASPIASAWRCCPRDRRAFGRRTPAATRLRSRAARATVPAAAALIRHLTSFDAQLGEARRGAIPCRASAFAAVRSEAAGEPAGRRAMALACRNREDDDRAAAVCGVSAV